MKWFKFYGQDYLSDPKMLSLTPAERSCWITLLCYASINDRGDVSFLSEQQLMLQSGIDFTQEEWGKTVGVLKKFETMQMLRNDNGLLIIRNWRKRQEKSLTAYERVKRYREKKRLDNENDIQKITLEENRIEKNIINTPASQDSLKVKNTKQMKKNSFGKYREDLSADSFETVIDADTGEEEKYKPKGSNAKLMSELIEWAVKRRGGNFVNMGKQYKAIANLKQAKISPEAIKNRWVELEGDEYHKLHGLDFTSIASSFDKKPI